MAKETDPKILLLEMQVDELSFLLEREEGAHRKASARATASERRNKLLRAQADALIKQLSTLEDCWNCPDLGNHDICSKCANNAVFSKEESTFIWNDPRHNANSKEEP